MTETNCTNCVGGLIKATGGVCDICEGKGVLQWYEQDEVFPQVAKVKKAVKKVTKAIKKVVKKKRK